MIASPVVGLLLAAVGAAVVLATGQGTRASALVGFLVAGCLVIGFGTPVLAPLATFVLGAGMLTRLGRTIKERAHAAEANRGRRTASQVLAKLALPALLGATALAWHEAGAWLAVAATAGMAGAFADTAATEIGPIAQGPVVRWSGLRLVRTTHGSVGGMSLAGIAGGALAAAALALVALAVGILQHPTAAVVAATAGFLATVLESAIATTPVGVRLGHGGRNVLVSVISVALCATIRFGGTS